MEKWIAKIKQKNGEVVEKEFPYTADGDEQKEEKEWGDIVDWIMKNHEVVHYSLEYVDE